MNQIRTTLKKKKKPNKIIFLFELFRTLVYRPSQDAPSAAGRSFLFFLVVGTAFFNLFEIMIDDTSAVSKKLHNQGGKLVHGTNQNSILIFNLLFSFLKVVQSSKLGQLQPKGRPYWLESIHPLTRFRSLRK